MRMEAEMLSKRFDRVLNYLKLQIAKAASEGIISLVARVVGNASGVCAFATFRLRVLFCLGKRGLSIA